jgi:hypothetical protein
VAVRLRHAESTGRLAFEVEFNQHGGLVPHDPAVVSRLNDDDLRRGEFQGAAVRELNVYAAAGQEAYMRVHAEFGASDLLHLGGPAESGRVDRPLDPAGARPDDIELDTPDFTVVGTLHGREEWIKSTHVDLLRPKLERLRHLPGSGPFSPPLFE